MGKKQPQPRAAGAGAKRRYKPLPSWAMYEIHEVTQAIAREQWGQAREALEAVDARCPRRPEVLTLLANVCAAQGDTPRLQRVARQMNDIAPGEPDTLILLTQSYYANQHPALALKTLDEFLRLHSAHPEAATMRVQRPLMQEAAEEILQGTSLSLDDEATALLHDEVNVLISEGRLKDAEAAARKLLERLPHYTPAYNNLSQIL